MQAAERVEEGLKTWEPAKDPNAQACPTRKDKQLSSTARVGYFSLQSILILWLGCEKAVPVQGDPFKTLFVARVSYDATEKKLKREFEEYGPVKRVSLIVDEKSGACTAETRRTVRHSVQIYLQALCTNSSRSSIVYQFACGSTGFLP